MNNILEVVPLIPIGIKIVNNTLLFSNDISHDLHKIRVGQKRGVEFANAASAITREV